MRRLSNLMVRLMSNDGGHDNWTKRKEIVSFSGIGNLTLSEKKRHVME